MRRGEVTEDGRVNLLVRTRRAVDAALDPVLELAHIAGPALAGAPRQRAGGEARKDVAPELGRHAAAEMLGEQRDVLSPVAQRRDGHDIEGETVQEIAAEAALIGQRRQIDISGGDDADVDTLHVVAADALEGAVLDDAQDLLLDGERGVGDLVEEQGAAVGDLEAREAPARRAGERARLMAEQLAVEQALGEGGAVELDEGAVPARR